MSSIDLISPKVAAMRSDAAADPEGFWARAAEALPWRRPWDRVFEWTLGNYDYIASHVPPSGVANLPRQAEGCSLERAARAREFFSLPGHDRVGTAKEVERMEAAVHDCVSLHEREGATVARYLGRVAALS